MAYRKRKPVGLLTAIILLVIFLPIAYFVSKNPRLSEAAWFDDTFTYRQRIEVANTGTSQTDFQVSITLDTAALISAGKMQSDCRDIRIVDLKNKILSHWVETNGLNACNNTATVIWVKVPTLHAGGTSLLAYYGNSSAVNTSDGNKVFIFFDDFNGASIDTTKWTNTGALLSISGNRLRADRVNGTGSLYSKSTFARPFILDMDYYPTQYPSGWEGNYHGSMSFGTFNSSKNTEHAWVPHGGGGNSYCGFCDDGGCYHGSYVNPVIVGDTLYKISMQARSMIAGPQGVMTYTNRKDDGTGSQANSTIYTAATTGDDPLYVGIKEYGNNTTDDFEWDNWRVRKYADTLPVAGSPASEEINPSPIAYWKFDEGYGTTTNNSSSISGLNGTLGTNASWKTKDQCISGMCLYIDDSGSSTWQTVTVNDHSSLGNMSALTVGVWIKTVSNKTTQQIIYKRQTNGTPAWSSFRVELNSLKPSFYVTNSSGTQVSAQADSAIEQNKWYYLTGIYDGSQVQIYVNAAPADSTPASLTGNVLDSDYRLQIGGLDTASSYYFKGFIDGVKIYPYARTTAQIKSDYNSRGSSKGTSAQMGSSNKNLDALSNGLVGYWKMDEASGNIADSSGNNNTGTVTGSNNFGSGKFGNSFRAGTASTNTVTNPSFEINTTGWADQTGGSMTQSNTTSQIGSYSVRTLGGSSNRIYTTAAATVGNVYTISAWVKTSVASKVRIGYELNGGDYVWSAGYSTYHTGSGNWERLTFTSPTLTSNTTIYFFLFNTDGAVYSYFDGIQVEQSSTATPYLDGTLGTGYSWAGTAHASTSTRTASVASVANSTSLNITSNTISFGAWINPTLYPDVFSVIFQKNGYTAGYRMMLRSTGKIYVGIGENIGGTLTSTGSISRNVWSHVLMTYDGLNIKIYINGVLDSSLPYTNNLLTSTTALSFGSTEYPFLTGLVDETRIYNRALSPAEVTSLYNWAPGPLAYWNFEEGIGQSMNDTSSNANSGQLGSSSGVDSADPIWTSGKYGKALDFNGSSTYAYRTMSPNFGGDVTFDFWYYPRGTGVIFDRNWGHIWFRQDSSTQASFYCHNGATVTGSAEYNKWHHVAGICNTTGQTASLYIDGVLVNTVAFTNPSLNTNPITLGSTYLGQGGNFFNGKIDDFKIYNYARTPGQIIQDMNAGHPLGGSPVGSQVAYYKFDEGSGTTAQDSSPNDYYATLYNTPTWTNNGKFGKALDFDAGSSEYLRVANTSNRIIPSGNSAFSISMWINPDSVTTATTKSILSNETYNVSGFRYGINTSSKLDFWSTESGGTTALTSTTTLVVGTWYHIVMAYDGSAAKLYINGKLEATDTTALIVSNTNNISFASAIGGKENYDGRIDEIKFYTATLTAEEIKIDFNQGAATVFGSSKQTISGTTTSLEYCIPGDTSSCSAPIAEWNFEEGSGTTTNDTSGNGYVGTITSGTWSTGKIGSAITFNGSSSKIAVGTLTGRYSNNVTVEAWVNHTTTANWDDIVVGGCGDLLFGFNSSSQLSWGGQCNSPFGELSYTTSIDGAWHHVVGTYDGSFARLYVDGTQVNSIARTGSFTPSALNIGGIAGEYFTGRIDQVKIYDYARTPAQVAYAYNRGAPVSHWKLDECQGTVANDSSGNGGTGTIVIGGGGTNTSAGTCTGSSSQAWKDGVTGKFNSSLEFDGSDDNVNIPITATNGQDVKGPISYSVWFKRADNGTYQTLISKIDACSGNINGMVLRFDGPSQLIFYGWKATAVFSAPYTSSTMSDGNWHHAVATWDGTTSTNGVKLYIDGSLVSQSTSTADNFTSLVGYNQRIGSLSCDAHYFNGQIDDVRIYNYALTLEQIKQVYTNGAINFGPATGTPQ